MSDRDRHQVTRTLPSEDPHWHSAVEAARIIGDAGELTWHGEADFVVIGFGGAGAAAALEACEQGLSVIALERFQGGGATLASGGVFYAGGGTPIQQDAGVSDDPENMFAYLRQETEGIVSDKTLMRFCQESAQTVRWLMAHGVEFRSTLWAEKTSYPPVDYFLYHSDSSLVSSYRKTARPAARGHRGYVPPEQGIKAINLGGSIYHPLRQAAVQRGTVVHEQAEARQLVLDRSGRVLGVKVLKLPIPGEAATQHRALIARAQKLLSGYPANFPLGGVVRWLARRYLAKARRIEDAHRIEQFYRARRALCISAGGFIFNEAMVKHHAPQYLCGHPIGTQGDDGSGIRLGQTAGGALGHMNRVSAWRFISPPQAWAQGIVVNTRGQRFIDESVYGARLGAEIGERQGGQSFLILDQRLLREALAQVANARVLPFQRDLARLNTWIAARSAPTLEALARKIGVDAAGLAATVETYNRAARGEIADPLGKSASDLRALLHPPYSAVDISLGARLFPCPTLTLGGLRIDEDSGQVAHVDGGVVPGLYAAGRSAVGVCSGNYVSGLSISDCIFSGRRAARHAAQQEPAA